MAALGSAPPVACPRPLYYRLKLLEDNFDYCTMVLDVTLNYLSHMTTWSKEHIAEWYFTRLAGSSSQLSRAFEHLELRYGDHTSLSASDGAALASLTGFSVEEIKGWFEDKYCLEITGFSQDSTIGTSDVLPYYDTYFTPASDADLSQNTSEEGVGIELTNIQSNTGAHTLDTISKYAPDLVSQKHGLDFGAYTGTPPFKRQRIQTCKAHIHEEQTTNDSVAENRASMVSETLQATPSRVPDNIYICTGHGCKEAFSNNSAWRRHMISCHFPPKLWYCRLCNTTLAREDRVISHQQSKKHKRRQHKDQSQSHIEARSLRDYCHTQCGFRDCHKEFATLDEYLNHEQAHLERRDGLRTWEHRCEGKHHDWAKRRPGGGFSSGDDDNDDLGDNQDRTKRSPADVSAADRSTAPLTTLLGTQRTPRDSRAPPPRPLPWK